MNSVLKLICKIYNWGEIQMWMGGGWMDRRKMADGWVNR